MEGVNPWLQENQRVQLSQIICEVLALTQSLAQLDMDFDFWDEVSFSGSISTKGERGLQSKTEDAKYSSIRRSFRNKENGNTEDVK